MRVSMRVSCCALPSSVGVPSDSTDASEDGRGARPPMRICATTPRASSAFMCIVSSFTRIIIGECVRGSASIYVPSQRACAKPTSDERCQRGWTLQLCGFTSSQSCMRQYVYCGADRASVPLFTHGSTMQSSSLLLLFALMRRYGSYEAGRVCVRPLPYGCTPTGMSSSSQNRVQWSRLLIMSPCTHVSAQCCARTIAGCGIVIGQRSGGSLPRAARHVAWRTRSVHG